MKKVWCRMKNPEIKSPVSPSLRLVDQLSQQDKERLISETVTDLPMGIAIFDAKGKLLHLNSEFANILPSDSDFSEIRQPEFLASLLSCIDGSSTVVAERWFEKLLDQSDKAPIEVANCTLADRATYCFDFAETKFGGSCIFATDISALNKELIVANAARVRAESEIVAKGDYLAMMTHELRTPMNGVVGMANLLLESNLDSEQRLFAETILSSGNSLLGIINKILNSSKEHSLFSIVENEAFDLERSIHEVILLLQTKAADQGLELVVDYDMFLPTAFLGDKGRIRQILLNLIGNAIKFTEQGHILVRVVGVPETEKAQNIHVTVEDTGMGIPKDQLGGVFDKYTQVESSQTDGIEGTGLGLAITKELVENMGGQIWADSEVGQGSSFGFSLEMNANETIPDPVQAEVEMPKQAAIISDLAISRQVMQKQLKAQGIAGVSFASARGAREFFQTNSPPDFVFIEHRPPALNGLRLALLLRKVGLSVPIVLMANRTEIPDLRNSQPINSKLLVTPARRADIVQVLGQLTGKNSDENLNKPSAPVPVHNGKLRVLVAEDNATNQLVFQKFVKDLEIDLRFVDDGEAAIKSFAEFKPALIFMDISMPNMDGREATRIIRATEDSEGLARTPIIALTAFVDMGDLNSFTEAGFDEFMTKPLNKAELCKAIESNQKPATKED